MYKLFGSRIFVASTESSTLAANLSCLKKRRLYTLMFRDIWNHQVFYLYYAPKVTKAIHQKIHQVIKSKT